MAEFIFSYSRYLDQTTQITIENNEQRRDKVVIGSKFDNRRFSHSKFYLHKKRKKKRASSRAEYSFK